MAGLHRGENACSETLKKFLRVISAMHWNFTVAEFMGLNHDLIVGLNTLT